ncbi:MAG: Holliday junction resolvase RuvX [Anaerolineales bacterium]|nr:Holliday junction resolvase RuvX [Anaerolineales bacterium]
MDFPGRLLGIDHGLQVLGFATCDAIGLIATPHSIHHRTSKQEDFAHINRLLEQERIAAIILGLPPRPPDFEGYSQSDTVRLWGQRLAATIQVPIYLWDEGLSSADAEENLHTIGKRVPERIDAYAAAVILQTFLDALREGTSWPDPLSAD